MRKNFKIVVDSFTCGKHKISPETYREKLNESIDFREADILLEHTNENLGGDFSRNAAIVRISYEGNPSDQDSMFDAARKIFDELKSPR